jgi:hypothetical protein
MQEFDEAVVAGSLSSRRQRTGQPSSERSDKSEPSNLVTPNPGTHRKGPRQGADQEPPLG